MLRTVRLAPLAWLLAACGDPICESDCTPPPDPPIPCADGTLPSEAGACERPGVPECAAGFERDPTGYGCLEIAAGDCPPGSRARLGQTACVPAGWSECPAGFEPAADGWGCAPILAAQPCIGARRELLGSTGCLPLDDCERPFPPADATHFVDARYTAAELDATHFSNVSDALTAAQVGDVIAVESSTYAETLLLRRAVRLVGRCAQRVIIRGSGELLPGLWFRGTAGAEVEGMTIRGHDGGIELDLGASASVRSVVVGPNNGPGVLVLAGTRIALSNSVIRPGPGGVRGIACQSPGSSVEDVSIVSPHDVGLYISGPGVSFDARRLVIRDARPLQGGGGGWGAYVRGGATLTMSESSILDSRLHALGVNEPGSSAALDHVVLRGVRDSSAVRVEGGAHLELSHVAVRDAPAFGVHVLDSSLHMRDAVIAGILHSTVENRSFALGLHYGPGVLENLAVVDNEGFGVAVEGDIGSLDFSESLVASTRGNLAPGVVSAFGAPLTLRGVTIRDQGAAGVLIDDTAGPSQLEEVIIEATRPYEGELLGAALVLNGTSATITRSVLRHNAGSGLGIGRLGGPPGMTAALSLVDTVVRDHYGRDGLPRDDQDGFGAWMAEGSTLTLTRSTFYANEFAGVGTTPRTLTQARHSAFIQSRPTASDDYGEGLYVQGALDLEDSAIIACATIGLQLHGPDAHAHVSRSLIDATLPKQDGSFGHGVVVSFGASLHLEGSLIRANRSSGVGVAEGSALISGSQIVANAIGLFVSDQIPLDEIETAPIEPVRGRVQVTRDTTFIDNGLRLNTGVLPIPTEAPSFEPVKDEH